MAIHYETVTTGEIKQVWCDECLASSAITFDCYILGDDGPINLGTYTRCLQHEPCTPRQVRDDVARRLGGI